MEKKFCKDCKFYKRSNPFTKPMELDLCTKFTFYPNLVRGEQRYVSAFNSRYPYPGKSFEGTSCGIEAKFFEPKEVVKLTPPPTSETTGIKEGCKKSWFYFFFFF